VTVGLFDISVLHNDPTEFGDAIPLQFMYGDAIPLQFMYGDAIPLQFMYVITKMKRLV
jgi:hypothetical protein